jgi:IclR family transcriptional regulator, KDG regulon repressor
MGIKSVSDGEGTTVRSVERAVDLLEELMSQAVPIGLVELSERVNLHPSTAHRLLSTLENRRFVYQDDVSKLYSLGPKLLYPAQGGQTSQVLRNFVNPILQEISQATGESTTMAIRSGNHALGIAKATSGRAVDVSMQSGALAPLHCTAVGKSILSHMDTLEVVKILEAEGMAPNTPNTITDLSKLLDELKCVRSQGFAVDNEEWEIGIRCVGVPVFSEDGRVFGAISVSGPAGRITREKAADLAKLIRQSAAKLSARLGYRLERSTSSVEKN